MGQVTYKPAEGDPETVTWGGLTFEKGKSVKTDNPAVLGKAKNNRFFEVTGTSKEEEQKIAQVVGGYEDANTGEEIALIRKPRSMGYQTPDPGPLGPLPPSAATQGSDATRAMAAGTFKEVYGVEHADFVKGDYEGAPEPLDVQIGTEGGGGQKRGPGRPKKAE